jgi:ubiquinone/menaquinone biosynthesis C-methylase UbiE
MRKFLWGLMLGFLLKASLEKVKANKYTQERIQLYYQRRAKSYHDTDRWVGFGDFQPRIRLRQMLLQQMNLKPGDRVLDVACGTGANFEYIMPYIGETGAIVGTDYSTEMLAEARKVIEQNDWKNVELVQADAAELELNETFDAVLCTLGLVVIPRYEEAMECMWQHLKPGGVYGIADLCMSTRSYMQPVNLLMDLLDATLITDTTRRPWEWLEARAQDYRRSDLLLGYMYAATGIKPA